MLRQQTIKKNGTKIQDLNFTYDPVGNITAVKDNCIPTTFFNNFSANNTTKYTYDPMYRLISAEGREHVAQTTFNNTDVWNNNSLLSLHTKLILWHLELMRRNIRMTN